MAKKKIIQVIKLQIPAGKAEPKVPIGPALGAAGVNIMAFCKEFNAKTQGMAGDILPTLITVYSDKSFTFVTRKPPVAQLLIKKTGAAKGSAEPHRIKVAKIKHSDVMQIAEAKLEEMNAADIHGAFAMVAGTARSMGIEVIAD